MRTIGFVAGFAASLAVLTGAVVAQQRPTFRSGVEIIVIDVNVVDGSHKPVEDLQPTDFLVTVDGKPRKVASAQFVRYDVGSTVVAGRQAVEPRAAPIVSGGGRPARNILVVIDNDSLEIDDGLAARHAAEQFVGRLAAGDRVGVTTLPFAGQDITITKDHDQVRKVIGSIVTGSERFRPTPYNIGLAEAFGVERGDRDLMNRIVGRECGADRTFCVEELKLVMRQMQTQEHLRGQRSLDGLLRISEVLKQLEGPKTMVLVSGGAPTPDVRSGYDYRRLEAAFASAQVTLYTIFIRQAQIGQVKTRLSPTYAEDATLERECIENATAAAGGMFMESIGSFEEYFERVVTELSGSYLVGIEVQAKDRDGRPHRAEVRVNRRGLTVRARRQYVIERAKAVLSPTSPADTTLSPAVRANRTDSGSAEPSRDVQAVLSRVIDYVANYRREYSGVVADEDYRQRTPTAQVRLRSDLLLVKTDDDEGWVSFRDVYEVHGVAVRDRDDRLRKLFLDPSTQARAQLQKIKEESARYNIGLVYRNVNVPLFPLLFLDHGNVARFEFTLGKRRESGGVRVLQIRFAEQQRPTIVRDMRASGSFLVDESTGAVVESETLYTNAAGQSAEIVIEYAKDPTLGVWVPAQMDESYTTREGSVLVRGTATYSKFRRFQVTTEEKIKIPK